MLLHLQTSFYVLYLWNLGGKPFQIEVEFTCFENKWALAQLFDKSLICIEIGVEVDIDFLCFLQFGLEKVGHFYHFPDHQYSGVRFAKFSQDIEGHMKNGIDLTKHKLAIPNNQQNNFLFLLVHDKPISMRLNFQQVSGLLISKTGITESKSIVLLVEVEGVLVDRSEYALHR